jgi:hypothetical protein
MLVRNSSCAIWAALTFAVYLRVAAHIPSLEWNAIEFIIANHLWDFGRYATGAEYPPAVWRPVLPTFLVLAVDRLTDDPALTFRIIVASSMAALVAGVYMAGWVLGGILLASIAALLVLTCPAFITSGVLHRHGIAQICALGLLGPTIAVSVACLKGRPLGERQPGLFSLLAAGALWGLSYLCRAEIVFAAAVFFVLLGAVLFRTNRIRWALVPLAGFLVFYLPHAYWVSTSIRTYDLLGGKAIYQFYNSQGWVDPRPSDPGHDTEREGYIYAKELYGTPEENSESVLRAMARNPAALLTRIEKNLRGLVTLALRRDHLPLYFPYLLLLSPLALWWIRPGHPHFVPLLFFLGSSLAVFSLALLHVDPRYPTIFIPFMVMAVVTLISCVISLGRKPSARAALGVGIFTLLALNLPEFGRGASRSFPNERFSLQSWRAIGNALLATLQPSADERRGMHVGLSVPLTRSDLKLDDKFMLYYFTRSALPLFGLDDAYPRWRIFSTLPCDVTHNISLVDAGAKGAGAGERQVFVEGVGTLAITASSAPGCRLPAGLANAKP